MKAFRKLYYKLVPTYKRLDFKIVTWDEGDKLIKSNPKWKIAKENQGLRFPLVALEITERITE